MLFCRISRLALYPPSVSSRPCAEWLIISFEIRETNEFLGLKFELGLGLREIARSCCLGLDTVHEYLQRAGWPLPEGWDEEKLEGGLFSGALPRAADPISYGGTRIAASSL